MAWDFETEPEFEEQLRLDARVHRPRADPARAHLRRAAGRRVADRSSATCRTRSRPRACGGPSSTRALGGQGLGQLKLALMSEIIGRCMMSMTIFGVQAPDSGNMELLAHGATDAQKERWLWPNLRGEISSAFALTEPFLAGSDPTVIGTTAAKDGDEWVINGHKWFITNASVADIVLVFAETNPEGRPHRHASVFVVPAGTPGMEIVRDISTMAHPDADYGRVGQPRRARVPRLPCARRPPDRPARRGVRPGPAAARRRAASTTPCAGSARPNARSTSCASGPCRAPPTASCWPAPDGPGLRGAVPHGDPGGPAAHLPDGVEDGQVRRRRRAGRPRHGQGPRVQGGARGARPHHPGLRRPRLLERPARGGVVPRRPGSARSATGPTSCTSRCWPAPC